MVFRGLRLVSESDEQTLEQGYIIMDALYAALSGDLALTHQQPAGVRLV